MAARLRTQGHEGEIVVIGAEPVAPYQRPPLSKDYLAGDKSFERLLIRPEAFWRELKRTHPDICLTGEKP